MRKLNLEQLEVESFETSGAVVSRGTVRAHEWTEPFQCGPDSNLVSCGGSCGYTNCGEHSCQIGCSDDVSCGGSCACATWDITCEYTAPNPEGTCCGITC
jgi:hypothetical protein